MSIKLSKKYKRFSSIGTVTALIVGGLSGTLASSAFADGGKESDTGIVWGEGELGVEEGTYLIPTSDGNEIEGFCIDPGWAWPKQNSGVSYGEAKTLSEAGIEDKLNSQQKNSILLAAYLGKAVNEMGNIDDITRVLNMAPGIDFPSASKDQIMAGLSAVVHQASGDAGMGDGSYTAPANLSTEAKSIKSNLEKVSGLAGNPIVSGVLKDVFNVEIKIREPIGANEPTQRMISVTDLELPEIDIPAPTVPSTSETTTETTPSTESTSTTTDRSNTPTSSSSTPVGRPEIRTSAKGSTGNMIESGTTIDDTVSYSGLEKGETYKLESRLMCKATEEDTGATKTHEFVAEASSGETVVEDIAVEDADCNEQVAFEKLYDEEGYLIAEHEDIDDAAQTVGGETASKKKPVSDNEETPQRGIGNGTGPAPQQQERKVINSVPSGEGSSIGSTIFNR